MDLPRSDESETGRRTGGRYFGNIYIPGSKKKFSEWGRPIVENVPTPCGSILELSRAP